MFFNFGVAIFGSKLNAAFCYEMFDRPGKIAVQIIDKIFIGMQAYLAIKQVTNIRAE